MKYRPNKRGKYEVELKCPACGETSIFDWELLTSSAEPGYEQLKCPKCGDWIVGYWTVKQEYLETGIPARQPAEPAPDCQCNWCRKKRGEVVPTGGQR